LVRGKILTTDFAGCAEGWGIVDLFGGFLGKGLILFFIAFNILFVRVRESFICGVVQGKVLGLVGHKPRWVYDYLVVL
jgi:hypothetical protein